MLDADMNARYWGHIARKYDKKSKIFVAVTASAAVGSLQIWKLEVDWFKWSWIWDSISVIAVVSVVALPFLDFDKIARKAESLRVSWSDSPNEYEALWLKRNDQKDASLQTRYRKLRKAEA